MSHAGNDELKEKALEEEDDVVEKEWTVTVTATAIVYDETKEGAEGWARDNLRDLIWNFSIDIEAEDNETAEEDMLPH